ncbi:MAG: hypothetical protein ACREOO_20360 [bacterium]
MARRPINQPVDVISRTQDGQLFPMQVQWNKKQYAVARVLKRRTAKTKEGRVEKITLSAVVWKEMVVEYHHGKRTWTLLEIELNG